MEGWIKLHRKLIENPIACKDADYLAVWVYLLLNATHAEYDGIFKGKRVTLRPGQLIVGRKSIATFLKINESKVQRILKSFKIEHQIEQQASNQNRLITILNWDMYQGNEQQNEQRVNNERTTSEQRVNTNKNDKNDKNDKNKDIYSSSHMTMAKKLKSLILSNNPGAKTPTDLSKWAAEFERMERIDKRTPEQIYAVMEFSQKDAFWKSNILSAKKLREKYDTLWLQKDRPKQTKPANTTNAIRRQYTNEEIEKLYSV